MDGDPATQADPAQGDADTEPDGDQKRSITYQMAKNKGLMPKRNRESRNPRVKHKEKFKRAIKKRRSLVSAVAVVVWLALVGGPQGCARYMSREPILTRL